MLGARWSEGGVASRPPIRKRRGERGYKWQRDNGDGTLPSENTLTLTRTRTPTAAAAAAADMAQGRFYSDYFWVYYNHHRSF